MNRKLGPQYDNQRKKPPLRQNQLLSPCPMLVSITTEEKAIFPFFFFKKKKRSFKNGLYPNGSQFRTYSMIY